MTFHRRKKHLRNLSQVSCESLLSIEEQAIHRLKQYWLSRALLFCNGIPLYFKNHFRNDEILEFIDIDENTLEDLKKSEIKSVLKDQCETLIAEDLPRLGDIFDNLHKVSQHFALNVIEEEILLFALILDLDSSYAGCYDLFGDLTNRSLFFHLSRILDIPEKHICNALQRSNLLSNSGLLKVNTDNLSTIVKIVVLFTMPLSL